MEPWPSKRVEETGGERGKRGEKVKRRGLERTCGRTEDGKGGKCKPPL